MAPAPRSPVQGPASVVAARDILEGTDHGRWYRKLVCWRRLGLREAPGLPSRCRRSGGGRAGVPARRSRFGRPVRLAGIGRGRPRLGRGAIEVPHGPVVDALLDRGFAVHAINPKQLERLRDRISLAGAKDDRRDARVAAGGLRTDPHLFRPVEAGDPAVIALREWSRLAEELQQERTRLSNRIRHQLWRYYPQLLEVSDDVTAEWVLDLWTLAPTPGLTASGVIAPFVLDGPMTGEAFRIYVEEVLAPELKAGNAVVMDNLRVHKVKGVEEAIRAVGGSVLYLPSYSPDLNPIEQFFAKLKGLLRKSSARTKEVLWEAVGRHLDEFTPQECQNYLAHCGYQP